MTSLDRFRWIGWLEGASFLVLLGIAMPLKYWFGLPLAVRIVGMAHGLLFLAYLGALLFVSIEHRWPLRRSALAVVASLVPFGPFLFDAHLQKQLAQQAPPER